MVNSRETILSGMQPTSLLHIGNYFGAIHQWLSLQKQHKCIFFVADLHSLTTTIGSGIKNSIYENSLEVLATYLACGINPGEETILFLQSQVTNHPYFHWILSCITPTGDLSRMVQMKDKSKQYGDLLGIFSYPVLMAADILLYNPTFVPVGEDQLQHLELVRTLAKKMNNVLGEKFFKEPRALNLQQVASVIPKVKDLQDGKKKMSKSSGDKSCLFLRDSNEVIERKIKLAKTDSLLMPSSIDNLEQERPEIDNLIEIYCGFTGLSNSEAISRFQGQQISYFKKHLTAASIEFISPLRSKIEDLLQNKSYLVDVFSSGKKKAAELSNDTLAFVTSKLLGHKDFI